MAAPDHKKKSRLANSVKGKQPCKQRTAMTEMVAPAPFCGGAASQSMQLFGSIRAATVYGTLATVSVFMRC